MITATSAFITAVGSLSRTWSVRLLLNGTQLPCSIKKIAIYKGACGEEVTAGSVYASYAELSIANYTATLEHQTIAIQFGLVNSYITVGTFEIIEVDESTDATNITAYGALSVDCGGEYSTSLAYPASVADVISELSTSIGKTISMQGITASGSILLPPSGTDRDALASVAAFLGGFVTDTADGNIVIAKLGSGGTKAVTTSMIPNAVEFGTSQTISGVTAESASVDMLLGDPRIEAFDKLSVSDLGGDTHTVLPLRIVHKFDGGFSSAIDGTFPSAESVEDVFRKGAISVRVQTLTGQVEELETEVEEARKVATNYMAFDPNEGLMVADMVDGEETPSTATGRNVLIDSDSVEIRDGQDILASFGETVRIGAEDSAHFDISPDQLTFLDPLGGVMGVISNGDSTPTQETIRVKDAATLSAGSVLEYAIVGQPDDDVVFALSRNDSEASVTFTEPGTATLTHSSLTASVVYDGATITCTVQTATAGEYDILLIYHTALYNPNIYVGSGALAMSGNAAAFGEGVITGKQAQIATGTYNAIERSTNTTHPSGATRYGRYALVVGNGTAAARSNALAFRWDGDIEMYIDTTASSSTYDGMIRDACSSLGWDIL